MSAGIRSTLRLFRDSAMSLSVLVMAVDQREDRFRNKPLWRLFDGNGNLTGGLKMAIEAQEQGNLIGSDKVEGTAVYGADNNKIGSIERVMIEKTSGKVSYAVLSFGGFLGMGNNYYPLPWHSLEYDPELGGYVTDLTEEQLKGAPRFNAESKWNWNDANSTRSVDDYYRM